MTGWTASVIDHLIFLSKDLGFLASLQEKIDSQDPQRKNDTPKRKILKLLPHQKINKEMIKKK